MNVTKMQTVEKIVTVQGAPIFVRERGAGAPVLFLHGVPDTADMWDAVIDHLGEGYHAIAPDMPGMGRSSTPADFDFSLEAEAQFVEDLIDALDIDLPVHLVAHDFGAHYGLAWAVRHPERVRTMTVTNTSFFTDYHWHQSAQMWRTPLLGEIMMRIVTPKMFINTMKKNAPNLSESYWQQVFALSFAKPSVRPTILSLYRTRNPQQDFVGWQDELRALVVRKPLQVLWGDADPFAAPLYAEKFGTKNVQHFAQYGHWLPVEAPKIYAERLADFFQRS